VAPNALARSAVLALLLGLAACGGKKEEEAAAPDLAAIRARRDSVRQAAARDSVARETYQHCSDSVLAVLKKTAAGRKKVAATPTGMIQPEVLQACGKPPAAPPQAMASAADTTHKAAGGDTTHPAPARPDTGAKAPAAAQQVEAPPAAPKPVLTPKQQQVLRADSIRQARERAKQDSLQQASELARQDSVRRAAADSVRQDSLRVARETEVLRETFTYAGGARDPFLSLISEDKVGPEFNDLLLVGIYLDLRRPSNSVSVLRDKTTQKRYKLRVGDRLGRLKVAQIRQRDVVFTVEDIGFERQETLSLSKREDQTP
jgi:hypothetical protein